MGQITLKVTKETLDNMAHHYRHHLLSPVPHSLFRAKVNGVTITAYTSQKVLFQGEHPEIEAEKWQESTSVSSKKPPKPTQHTSTFNTTLQNATLIGSDEAGNGSYFGALPVCAVYLTPRQQEIMSVLGVQDSKKLSDAHIQELAPQIKAVAPYAMSICFPKKYNTLTSTHNANEIKALLHNFTLLKLINKLSESERKALDGVIIDQFTPEKNYYNYLKNEPKVYRESVHFEKKAESQYLAVACASILARDAFIQSLKSLGEPFNCTLPSGASSQVDAFARRLVKQYGPEVLYDTAKYHFANTKKILQY